jgi:hypothetical protein
MSDFGQKTTPLGRGQGGDEECPISDNGPPLSVEDRGVMRNVRFWTKEPLLVEDRGVMRNVRFWTKDHPSW